MSWAAASTSSPPAPSNKKKGTSVSFLLRASGMASTPERSSSRRSLIVLSRRLRNSLNDLITDPRLKNGYPYSHFFQSIIPCWLLLKHPRRPPVRDASLEGALEKRFGKAKPRMTFRPFPFGPLHPLGDPTYFQVTFLRMVRVSRWGVWGKKSKGTMVSTWYSRPANRFRSRAKEAGLQDT
jgi:hypothetical protein